MEIKEAIVILAAMKSVYCDAFTRTALAEAIHALEKQEAKKIKEIHVDEYYCPVCDAENNCDNGNVDDNYCPNCGQKIYQKINYLKE